MLQKPIYVNVAESRKSQEFHIQPEEIDTVRDRSADGIVEAYETDHIMAIQSHPEKKMIQQGEEKWLALFREFVKGCK